MPSFGYAVGRPHAQLCPSVRPDRNAFLKAENYPRVRDAVLRVICHNH